MDTSLAFARGAAARASGAKSRVFDWNKAAQYFRDNGTQSADAGLSTDLEWTGGTILKDGKPVTDEYTFLESNWAIPVIVLSDGAEIECWAYEDESEFDKKSKWPESALDILKGTTNG